MKLSAPEVLRMMQVQQVVLIPVGVPGSGKSTLAGKLSRSKYGFARLAVCSTDEIRKGNPASTEDDVFRQFFDDASRALREGCSVYLDATHVREARRCDALRLAEREGKPALFIYMDILPVGKIPRSRMNVNVPPIIADALVTIFNELRPEHLEAPWVSASDLSALL